MITASEINQRFEELNASTNENAYSGLTAEDISEGVVKIFDDYSSGEYNADKAIAILEALEPIDWDEHDNTESAFDVIWQGLAHAEV